MPLFIVGAPRSGTTIVAQTLNTHHEIKIFDEISLIDVAEFGEMVVGKLMAFLMERGVYGDFRTRASDTHDPLEALRLTMTAATAPRPIWGEKNPMYATRLDDLRRCFPEALILFVLRDPREVINSYLVHRDSPSRSPLDFWIKDTVADALDLMESCLAPLQSGRSDLTVLRYEAFIAQPRAVLEEALSGRDVKFADDALRAASEPPETVGDHQFFRRGAPLPWKLGNLAPLQSSILARDRLDASDPAWRKVERLAREFGYA